MPYPFTFDLSKMPRSLFKEAAKIAHNKNLYRRLGEAARYLLKKFRIQELTGLDFSEAIQLMEDFIEIQMRNIESREKFLNTKKRVLLLPHCSRKYMDSRCKAFFDPTVPSYYCAYCSRDCLIYQATLLGRKFGYDVYVLPGGSCIKQILKRKHYDAVVGVACGMEIKLAERLLQRMNLTGQAVPLIKNGCAETRFNIETLYKILNVSYQKS